MARMEAQRFNKEARTVSKHTRLKIVAVLALIAMAPITLAYLMQVCLVLVSDGIQWCVEGRAWTRPFVRASELVELHVARWLGVDADTMYEEWREHMRRRADTP
ncbi:MAG TPA: hypothetical protein VKT73_13025 [Xanthobacteraceae bacterium]|nr:hypothetical protein [Xanthobacteraceae bacterium]